MGVLRFIWRGVLAFDRVGSRIPQLIQIWLIELFFAVPLTFFIAKLIDTHGAFGVPGTGESMPGVFWGSLVVSLLFGFFFFKSLIRPRVVHGSWTPVVHAEVGGVNIYGQNRRWTTSYDYLTSHPSYSLLLLLTAPIPAVMLAATTNHGDNTFYWRVMGIVGLAILALMALARVIAWYIFRFGRRLVDDQAAEKEMSQRKLAWEIAWKPVLMLMVMVYAIVCIPLGWMFFQQHRTIAGLPVVTVDDTDHAGEYLRIEGLMLTDAVYWAPRGTGRSGNNYSGAGGLVELPSGGEALLLAESLSVPDFVGVMADTKNGGLEAQGKVIDAITEDQQEYYGFDEDAFPDRSPGGRVMMLLSYP